MQINTGQLAPDFVLNNTEGNPIRLSDFRGKHHVLILFFPKAFTRVCTDELCSVKDDLSRYEQLQARILGISVDSPSVLADYKKELQLNFTLLSDEEKKVSDLYGSIYHAPDNPSVLTVSKRSAFVIDKQGVVQYSEVLEDAYQVPDFMAINAVLDRLT